jgi:hypothetical protein
MTTTLRGEAAPDVEVLGGRRFSLVQISFSVAGECLTVIMRFSAGLEKSRAKSVCENSASKSEGGRQGFRLPRTEGHGFSRAVKGHKYLGLQPLRYGSSNLLQQRNFPLSKAVPQRLKPFLHRRLSARLKPCPSVPCPSVRGPTDYSLRVKESGMRLASRGNMCFSHRLYSRWIELQLPLLKQGAPTTLEMERSAPSCLVLTQTL